MRWLWIRDLQTRETNQKNSPEATSTNPPASFLEELNPRIERTEEKEEASSQLCPQGERPVPYRSQSPNQVHRERRGKILKRALEACATNSESTADMNSG